MYSYIHVLEKKIVSCKSTSTNKIIRSKACTTDTIWVPHGHAFQSEWPIVTHKNKRPILPYGRIGLLFLLYGQWGWSAGAEFRAVFYFIL